jgi:hypothetical protein
MQYIFIIIISYSYQMLGSHDSNFGILIPSKIMWVQSLPHGYGIYEDQLHFICLYT